MFELIIFLLGLAVGSFLNVCAYRLPAGESVVSPPSRCRACGVRLGPVDLIPVLSYILRRGRCRSCGAAFSARYALVEFATGALFVWCFFVFGIGPSLVKALVLTSFLVVITLIDFDHQLIYDKVLIWLAGAGVAINLSFAYLPLWGSSVVLPVGPLDMLLGGLLGGGLLLAIIVVTRGGMGGGDLKFAAALGLWFGWQQTLLALFLAFLAGGFGGGALLLLRIRKRKDLIPFGPFIAIGAFVTLLYGPDLVAWYVRHFLGR
ncbi:prepilin peptidase [Anaeroselena agilis]|uniref:Prepilin leader peptidase/N-methyltransferase n=1 Tax=Anaeroselena agilis TaxID=3063788 RepID=A0ABU3NYC8_9FIRM|nr:prepilin peptidase [Selenomonadales bacterium 4137-cl]